MGKAQMRTFSKLKKPGARCAEELEAILKM